MDTESASSLPFSSPLQVADRLGHADAPLIIDVRKAAAFDPSARMITGALRILPEEVSPAAAQLTRGRAVVAYCVHADTGKPELTPQSAGLLAVSLGLSRNFPDDHAMLEHGMVLYDALYAWVKSARGEAHNADLFRR